MNHLILIRGALGVGKSTIANLLKEKLQAYYISIDRVLEELNLDKAEGEGIPVKNFIAANEHVLLNIQEHLHAGEDVIVDGCFYHKEQINHLERNLPSCIVFTLKAPLAECIERDKNREHTYGEGAAEAVYNLVSCFDYGTVIETASKTPKEVTAEIFEKLDLNV